MNRVALTAGLGLVLLACLPGWAGAATLPVAVQIQSPDGTRVVVSGEGSLRYPASGALVRAASVALEGESLVFRDLSLLGGRLTAERLVVPASGVGQASVTGLEARGETREGLPNEVVPLPRGAYAIALQESLDGQHRVLAGLLVHLGARNGRLPAGTEILVGVPAEAAPPGYVYPLAQAGAIIGCPFALGSTHSALVAPDNLPSDNAVDIAAPIGTPVYAVAAGTIGPQIGPLGSSDPHMAGLRLHLDTPAVRFYYAHLSQIDVVAGQQVETGQQLGLSGSAAGAAHLHFAQDVGNPAETVGALGACPGYQPYLEPWG
jgi:peptidase M23-like protein